MKYKVGDKVRIVSQWVPGCRQNPEGRMDKWLGKVMTIREVTNRGYYHMAEDRHERLGGWSWWPESIAGLACEQKIVVTTDGKVTTAKLFDGKQLVKAATAKCSDGDTFDFAIGATLAIERLLLSDEKAEPEKLFPLEEIKAGYLLKIRTEDDEEFFMTVVPGLSFCVEKLGVCCPGEHWWPLDAFDEKLRKGSKEIVAVYGYVHNMYLLDNKPDGRELLWSRD